MWAFPRNFKRDGLIQDEIVGSIDLALHPTANWPKHPIPLCHSGSGGERAGESAGVAAKVDVQRLGVLRSGELKQFLQVPQSIPTEDTDPGIRVNFGVALEARTGR